MKKREILIAVIIALGLAGCRAEKDNISSVPVNTESSITETVSDISETPADASSNKTAEITEKPESSAPAESRNENLFQKILLRRCSMKIYREESLSNFEFWSGAIANAEEFTLDELDRIGEELEAADNGDGYEETQINDLMWFEPEYLASLIGLEWDGKTGKVIR